MSFVPPLIPDEIREFQKALLSAFRNKAALQQMVFFGMSEQLNTIVDDAPLGTMVLNLIQWAVDAGRDDDLLKAATDKDTGNPGNPDLKAFAAKMANRKAANSTGTATGSTGSTDGGASNHQDQGAVRTDPPAAPPERVAPRTADPLTLSIADQDRLRGIIQRLFTKNLNSADARIGLLSDAQISDIWIGNFTWGDPAAQVAGRLVSEAGSQGFPLQEGRRGYAILGAILNQILDRQLVGLTDGQYLASVIARYRLIDFNRKGIGLSPLLQGLMQFVPQVTDAAEAAVRQLVGFDQFFDAVWLDQGAAACRAVCRVENPFQWGTGFLVGPDLVLTNYHVMQEVLADPNKASQVILRFGFKRRADGTIDNGDPYNLADNDWAVDNSPNVAGSLDYALLRLADPAGSDPVGEQKRGWLKPVTHQFRQGEDLYIIQHPLFKDQNPAETQPLKVVLAPNAVDSESQDRSRVTYATNTEHGSSGSPCFLRDWSPVALHHSALTATSNEGIPLDTICAQPKVKAALGL